MNCCTHDCRQGRDCPARHPRHPRALRFITTPAGVRIGWVYVPKAPALSRDQEHVQAALLEPRTAAPLTKLQRVLGTVWRWL